MKFSSLGRFRRRYRISIAEFTIVLFAPVFAFVLRGVDILAPSMPTIVSIYVLFSVFSGLVGLFYVNLFASVSSFISNAELLKIFKVAAMTSIGGVIGMFFFQALMFLPRYVPIIHFLLVLAAFTLFAASRARSFDANIVQAARLKHRQGVAENQLLIGSGPISAHYAAMIDSMPNIQKKIAGIVSISGDLVGSTLGGRTVVGPIDNFQEIISEFSNHGIAIDRVVIGAIDDADVEFARSSIASFCEARSISISLVRDFFQDDIATEFDDDLLEAEYIASSEFGSHLISRYLVLRQKYEFIFAFLLALVLLPIFLVVGLIVFLDVGRPLVFWQKRIGRNQMMITIHKFRTLPHKYQEDQDGDRSASVLGRMLQTTRLDELPQVYDILQGQVSFIGPRPLLPHDLPRDVPLETDLRHKVLPGLTGWAQVHGGKQVTAKEKIALDIWYLRHATFWLDVKILIMTVRVVFGFRDRRDEKRIDEAVEELASLREEIERVSS